LKKKKKKRNKRRKKKIMSKMCVTVCVKKKKRIVKRFIYVDQILLKFGATSSGLLDIILLSLIYVNSGY
jgi:hypothetical protein